MVTSSAGDNLEMGEDQMVTSSDPHLPDGHGDGPEGDSTELPPREATKYRAVSARLNYLCQDRLDIAYACKEAARKMSKPQLGDWHLLKRIARYLKVVPRLCQRFEWQSMPARIDCYVDSDWAGCKRTGR